MKILEIIPTLCPGGGERFTVDLANELSLKHDVTLLVMRKVKGSAFYEKELSSKVKLYHLNGKENALSKILQVFISLYWIVRIQPDVVHGHLVAFNWLILPSVLLCQRTRFYFTVHNLADQECTTKIGFLLRRLFCRHLIRAVTISDVCASSFKKHYGFPPSATINNGCRNVQTTSELQSVQNEILNYKQNSKTKVFVNVARIMPQKNQDLLIRAFNQLISEEENVALLIIGSDASNPELKCELEKKINNKHIHFIGTRNNVADYLTSADYFCLSSSFEGLPISLLEAGLCGCYPVSTPVGGVVDVIKSNDWGIMSKDLSVCGYVDAIRQALSLTYSKTQLAELYSEYLMDRCANKYEQIFLLNSDF